MKRSPLKRKTPLRANPEKTRAWKDRSRKPLSNGGKPMKQRSSKRAKQERHYLSEHARFIAEHPVCPVTGDPATQIHHSAKREGRWINLKRYWISVSQEGHRWIEDNKREAEKYGLMVRIFETYEDHSATLIKDGVDFDRPVFYDNHPQLPLVNENGHPLWQTNQNVR